MREAGVGEAGRLMCEVEKEKGPGVIWLVVVCNVREAGDGVMGEAERLRCEAEKEKGPGAMWFPQPQLLELHCCLVLSAFSAVV